MLHFIGSSMSINTVLASTPKPTPSQPDYSLPNLILMTIYVAATLVLVGVTIWQARAILTSSAKQSKDAIEAVQKQIEVSELQSQAAIAAVHEQIEASRVQSQAAIDAIHQQIEASERQAQEAIQNQYKPVIVPRIDEIKITRGRVEINIENTGSGIALSVWGTVGLKDFRRYYSSMYALFLTPTEKTEASFASEEMGTGKIQYPYEEFFETPTRNDATETYSLFPVDDSDWRYQIRLILTYKDIFENKYLAIFDNNDALGWKLVVLKKTNQTMDELAYRIHQRDFGTQATSQNNS